MDAWHGDIGRTDYSDDDLEAKEEEMEIYREFGDHNNSNDEHEGENDMATEYEGGNTENEEVEVIDGEVVDGEEVVEPTGDWDEVFTEENERLINEAEEQKDEARQLEKILGGINQPVPLYAELEDNLVKALANEIISSVDIGDMSCILSLGSVSQDKVTQTSETIADFLNRFEKSPLKGKTQQFADQISGEIKRATQSPAETVKGWKDKTVHGTNKAWVATQNVSMSLWSRTKSWFNGGKTDTEKQREKSLNQAAKLRNQLSLAAGEIKSKVEGLEEWQECLKEQVLPSVQALGQVRVHSINLLKVEMIATAEILRRIDQEIKPDFEEGNFAKYDYGEQELMIFERSLIKKYHTLEQSLLTARGLTATLATLQGWVVDSSGDIDNFLTMYVAEYKNMLSQSAVQALALEAEEAKAEFRQVGDDLMRNFAKQVEVGLDLLASNSNPGAFSNEVVQQSLTTVANSMEKFTLDNHNKQLRLGHEGKKQEALVDRLSKASQGILQKEWVKNTTPALENKSANDDKPKAQKSTRTTRARKTAKKRQPK